MLADKQRQEYLCEVVGGGNKPQLPDTQCGGPATTSAAAVQCRVHQLYVGGVGGGWVLWQSAPQRRSARGNLRAKDLFGIFWSILLLICATYTHVAYLW